MNEHAPEVATILLDEARDNSRGGLLEGGGLLDKGGRKRGTSRGMSSLSSFSSSSDMSIISSEELDAGREETEEEVLYRL